LRRMSPFPFLCLHQQGLQGLHQQGHRSSSLFSTKPVRGHGENRVSKHTEQKTWRVHKKKDYFPAPRAILTKGLPVQALGPYTVSSPPLPPEEEVFSISLEKEKRAPSWQLDFVEKLKGESLAFLRPQSPPLKVASKEDAELPATPKPMVQSLNNPPTPRRIGKVPRGKIVHKYRCEDVMEYAVDVFAWKKSLETFYLPGDWTRVQTDITVNMRAALLKWLVGISRLTELSLETWCLAVNYLDRFLQSQPLASECLQLTGITALWVAAKQEEAEPPEAKELVRLCDSSYCASDFKHMEVILLDRLKFNLAAPTPAYLISHMVEVGEEIDWPEDICRHLIESTLQDYGLSLNPPSRIAHCIFSVLKSCDPECLRVVEAACPECEPSHASQECANFMSSALHRIAAILMC